MATGTAGTQAREFPTQQTHYIRGTVNFDTTGISTGVKLGTRPAGSEILRTTVKIKTAFNAGTTNVLTVGENATNYNDYVASGDVDEAVTQSNVVLRGADLAAITADKDVYAKYTQTGTAATTGQAIIIVEYVCNNDMS